MMLIFFRCLFFILHSFYFSLSHKEAGECLVWSCHYATGCFVEFLGDIFTLKYEQILWTTVRLHGKKLQNATNFFILSYVCTSSIISNPQLVCDLKHFVEGGSGSKMFNSWILYEKYAIKWLFLYKLSTTFNTICHYGNTKASTIQTGALLPSDVLWK